MAVYKRNSGAKGPANTPLEINESSIIKKVKVEQILLGVKKEVNVAPPATIVWPNNIFNAKEHLRPTEKYKEKPTVGFAAEQGKTCMPADTVVNNKDEEQAVPRTKTQLKEALLDEEVDIEDENEVNPTNENGLNSTTDCNKIYSQAQMLTKYLLQNFSEQNTEKCEVEEGNELLHSEAKPISFSQCTVESNSLKLQLDRLEIKPFTCSECDFESATKSDVKKHELIHWQEDILECSKCPYKTWKKSRLKEHQEVHGEEMPFSCDYCVYKCKTRKQLNRHRLNHLNKKRFECNHCGYKCVQRKYMDCHLLIHSGVKPFACNYCDYKCTQKGNLNRHITMIHSGEKPISCIRCSYKCMRISNLNRHVRLAHLKESFACDQCGHKSYSKFNLKRHQLRHLQGKPIHPDISYLNSSELNCSLEKQADDRYAQPINDKKLIHLEEKPIQNSSENMTSKR